MPRTEPIFFDFEADFVQSLRCIPMVVRYKLDTCGIKLKLEQWHRFSETDRQALVTRHCDTPNEIEAYRQGLVELIRQSMNTEASPLAIDPSPPWLNAEVVPPSVLAQAQQVGLSMEVSQWQQLQPLQRFALLKLSRPGHENRNFRPALAEFKLTDSAR